MRIREIIIESYPLAKKEFSQMAKPDEVQATIDQYRELVRKNQFRNPAEKNINYWRERGWEAFSQMVKVKSGDVTDTQMKKGKVADNAIILHNDNEWVVLVPLDKDTSVHYGRGTEWCTTKPHQLQFEDYVYRSNITLIYAIDKSKSGRSVAISIRPPNTREGEQIEMFNQQDGSISPEQYNELSGFDPEEFIKLAKLPENQQLLAASREKYKIAKAKTSNLLAETPLDPEAIERELKITKDTTDCYNYIINYSQEQNSRVTVHPSVVVAVSHHKSSKTQDNAGQYIDFTNIPAGIIKSIIRMSPDFIWWNYDVLSPTQKNIIISTPDLACKYAIKIKNPFPAGEPAIVSDTESSSEYTSKVLKYHQSPSWEQLIKDDPALSSLYAVAREHPFPAGEAAIARNRTLAIKYDKLFGTKLASQETNTEWEQSIKDDPLKAYEYAEAIDGRFPSGEAAIATNIQLAYNYAAQFASQLPDNRFAAGEPIIATNAEYAEKYAVHVLNGEFPAGEKSIAKTAQTSYIYAIHALHKKRFPAGEPAIAKDKFFSTYYAITVIEGAFPAGEFSIAKDAHFSFLYATQAIKRRFPAGEAKIATNKRFRNEYNELFGTNLARP